MDRLEQKKTVENEEDLMFNDVRVSCGEIFVVAVVVVVLEGEVF
jgi:hypothetical protein